MNKEEYEDKLAKINSEHKKNLDELYCEYARSNNPCKVGDIIETYGGFGEVLKFRPVIGLSTSMPQMKYLVKRLTKKLQPVKRGQIEGFEYQSNIKSINGVPVK